MTEPKQNNKPGKDDRTSTQHYDPALKPIRVSYKSQNIVPFFTEFMSLVRISRLQDHVSIHQRESKAYCFLFSKDPRPYSRYEDIANTNGGWFKNVFLIHAQTFLGNWIFQNPPIFHYNFVR